MMLSMLYIPVYSAFPLKTFRNQSKIAYPYFLEKQVDVQMYTEKIIY